MKSRMMSFCAAAVAVSFVACSNNADTSATPDTSGKAMGTTATAPAGETATSAGTYAAMADTIERNATAGHYWNPKTGKKYTSLKVDRTTGAITDDAGEQVWRYVDDRNWWVYGDDNMEDNTYNWNQVGEAKQEGEKLMYKGDGDKWTDYDTKWKKSDEDWIKKHKVSDNGMKEKIVTEDGDKIKVKTDEEGNTKIKVNDEKVKVDKDGNVKKKDN